MVHIVKIKSTEVPCLIVVSTEEIKHLRKAFEKNKFVDLEFSITEKS
jgi:hypothetical protein